MNHGVVYRPFLAGPGEGVLLILIIIPFYFYCQRLKYVYNTRQCLSLKGLSKRKTFCIFEKFVKNIELQPMERQLVRDLHWSNAKRLRPAWFGESGGHFISGSVQALWQLLQGGWKTKIIIIMDFSELSECLEVRVTASCLQMHLHLWNYVNNNEFTVSVAVGPANRYRLHPVQV